MRASKRILSVILSVVLVVGLSPEMSYASEPPLAVGSGNTMLSDNAVSSDTELGNHFKSMSAETALTVNQVSTDDRGYTSAALTSDGVLWLWGSNGSGQIGDGTTDDALVPVKILEGVQSVHLGDRSTMALKVDGSVWAWGYDSEGLGDGHLQHTAPTKIMDGVNRIVGDHALITNDGSLWAWGNGSRNATEVLKNVVTYYEFGPYWDDYWWAAITEDGSLWMWGSNDEGRLGNGTKTDQKDPVRIMGDVIEVRSGGEHTLALASDGSLWAWGFNKSGQLGNGSYETQLSPVKVMDGVSSVFARGNSSAALNLNGEFYAWGYSPWNEGISNATSTDDRCYSPELVASGVLSIPGDRTILKDDGTLWGWGYDQMWKIYPNGGYNKYALAKLADGVASAEIDSDSNGYAIGKDGTLYRLKYDLNWKSADKMFSVSEVLSGVSSVVYGAYLSPTLALCEDGSMYAWGDNGSGQLGDGTTIAKREPTVIFSDGVWTHGYKVPNSSQQTGEDTSSGSGKNGISDSTSDSAGTSGSASSGSGEGPSRESGPSKTDGTSSSLNNSLAVGDVVTAGSGASEALYVATGNTTVRYEAIGSKNLTSAVVPDTVVINGKTYRVTQIADKAFSGSKAKSIVVGENITSITAKTFAGASKVKTITIGKNVKKIAAKSFKTNKALRTIILKTTKVAKKSTMKNCLKGSKVKTVKVKVGKKSLNKKYRKKYKKLFASKKPASGKKVKVK